MDSRYPEHKPNTSSPEGGRSLETGDKEAVKRVKAEVRAEKAEEMRKMRGRRRKGP